MTVEEALRYAMSLPVATTISGIDSLAVLRQNLAIARGFQPMTAEEMEALRKRCAAGRRRRPPGAVQVHDEVRRRPGPRAARHPVAQGDAAVERGEGSQGPMRVSTISLVIPSSVNRQRRTGSRKGELRIGFSMIVSGTAVSAISLTGVHLVPESGCAPTEPPTGAPRRCVDSGACPEPENPSVSLRFSL